MKEAISRRFSRPSLIAKRSMIRSLEKGYWIMHAVFGLKQLALTFDGGQMHMFFAPRWKTVVHLVVNAADLHTMPTQSQLQAGSRKQTLFLHYPERR
jgi:hypothetical protein